jgi:hypothetical protein
VDKILVLGDVRQIGDCSGVTDTGYKGILAVKGYASYIYTPLAERVIQLIDPFGRKG